MSISSRLEQIRKKLPPHTRLAAVSKFNPPASILEAYDAGQRIFGESKVQEITAKYNALPPDIEWHFIGHLQTNKVKYIAPFIDTVQSADSIKLIREINKQAALHNRQIKILLQIHIAREEHKFGFSYDACRELLSNRELLNEWKNIVISGLMGMATYTEDESIIRTEFAELSSFFKKIKTHFFAEDNRFNDLSIGMSNDYLIAIEEGSTLVRIGSSIFGSNY